MKKSHFETERSSIQEITIMEITYKGKNHIHFIGIGGISMSGLAEMLAARGMHISGSDAK